jgi:putative acetyltransferase
MLTRPTNAPGDVAIERVESPTDEVRVLIEALDRELSANYPPDQRHALALSAIFQPHIRFFIARVGGEAVGCGGIALFADFAEVKRMYVRPDARGRGRGRDNTGGVGVGVADSIVARLANEALDAGLKTLRLETGTEQAAAIRFYQRCGFQRCNAFEPYASMPPKAISTSVFMEMPIRAR